ncbi:hypothetical protein QL285_028379 [Trifolium repens]|nr:hypothetical protein QL285_028379 [Trifolium repens]
MRRFLVPGPSIKNVNVVQAKVEEPSSIEKLNVVQMEAEVEEPPPNVANEFNSNEIVCDPGRRKQIHEYAPDIQYQMRRTYILKGQTQPILERFPRTEFGSSSRTRKFCKSWYEKYTGIKYSEFKDSAYCFHCLLFKQPGRADHFGYEVFTKDEFKDWKHASQGLKDHVGGHGSMHNLCMKHYDDYNIKDKV